MGARAGRAASSSPEVRGLSSRIRVISTVKTRRILSDGSSTRIRANGAWALRSQERLYEVVGARRA